jgi:hypothetical protein
MKDVLPDFQSLMFPMEIGEKRYPDKPHVEDGRTCCSGGKTNVFGYVADWLNEVDGVNDARTEVSQKFSRGTPASTIERYNLHV